MSWLKQKLYYIRALLIFAWGALIYWLAGRTPPAAYRALIQLFCLTGGRFNDFLSRLLAKPDGRLKKNLHGALGPLDEFTLDAKVNELRAKGYLVFPAALSTEQCARLMQFAMTTPALVRRMDGEGASAVTEPALYDPQRPLAVRYDYPPQDLLDCQDVQALLADPTLLAVARRYLGTNPKADVLTMWWHTNYHSQPDSEAAQLYHFDMDRIKWLKVFIYLTDVGPRDGAHSFIAESHKTNGIPQHFLSRGYVRLSDDEVFAHYGKSKEMEFIGPKGTIIVEDTRGLHKGSVVAPNGSPRLVLQLQFSNSLFGGETPSAKLRHITSPSLRDAISAQREVFSQYL